MNPSIGLGTRAMLAAAIAACGSAIAATVHAGWAFYSDPGVCSLQAAAILAVLGLFAGRSYQAGKLAEGTDPTRSLDGAPDALPATATDVDANYQRAS